ncbi:hypothetical protein [Numidum massiliense]|uniref:hypothetical protein n=1 Tax=Numidum massiliense TaxID=1522315 RepID=UPI00164EB64A|nr:hypothetical protein [Numidum massiliense]
MNTDLPKNKLDSRITPLDKNCRYFDALSRGHPKLQRIISHGSGLKLKQGKFVDFLDVLILTHWCVYPDSPLCVFLKKVAPFKGQFT